MRVSNAVQIDHLNAFSSWLLAHQAPSIAELTTTLENLLDTTIKIWLKTEHYWQRFEHQTDTLLLSDLPSEQSQRIIFLNDQPTRVLQINPYTLLTMQPGPDFGELEIVWEALLKTQYSYLLHELQLLDQERHRDNAIASIAHDLKNPLTTIRGSAELLLRRSLRDERTEREIMRLQTIIEQTDRMRDFLGTLVDVARLHAGDLPLIKHPLDVAALLERTIQARNSSSSNPRIQLTLEPVPLIAADQIWFERVIENLLDNALKYSPMHTRVDVKLQHDQHQVIITIEDRGIGILAEDSERIFDRFIRGKNSSSMSSGSGLGLYTVQTVIKAHDGSIKVHSAGLNQGSTFTILIPFIQNGATQ